MICPPIIGHIEKDALRITVVAIAPLVKKLVLAQNIICSAVNVVGYQIPDPYGVTRKSARNPIGLSSDVISMCGSEYQLRSEGGCEFSLAEIGQPVPIDVAASVEAGLGRVQCTEVDTRCSRERVRVIAAQLAFRPHPQTTAVLPVP